MKSNRIVTHRTDDKTRLYNLNSTMMSSDQFVDDITKHLYKIYSLFMSTYYDYEAFEKNYKIEVYRRFVGGETGYFFVNQVLKEFVIDYNQYIEMNHPINLENITFDLIMSYIICFLHVNNIADWSFGIDHIVKEHYNHILAHADHFVEVGTWIKVGLISKSVNIEAIDYYRQTYNAAAIAYVIYMIGYNKNRIIS